MDMKCRRLFVLLCSKIHEGYLVQRYIPMPTYLGGKLLIEFQNILFEKLKFQNDTKQETIKTKMVITSTENNSSVIDEVGMTTTSIATT